MTVTRYYNGQPTDGSNGYASFRTDQIPKPPVVALTPVSVGFNVTMAIDLPNGRLAGSVLGDIVVHETDLSKPYTLVLSGPDAHLYALSSPTLPSQLLVSPAQNLPQGVHNFSIVPMTVVPAVMCATDASFIVDQSGVWTASQDPGWNLQDHGLFLDGLPQLIDGAANTGDQAGTAVRIDTLQLTIDEDPPLIYTLLVDNNWYVNDPPGQFVNNTNWHADAPNDIPAVCPFDPSTP
jgi:hypothetical protein